MMDDGPIEAGTDTCIGIDLAGVERRETGVAVLRGGRLTLLAAAATDEDILAQVAQVAQVAAGSGVIVAINAPLTLPRGRCCLRDDCPCRDDPGTRSRQLERELLAMGVPILATALIKVLARRGIALAAAMRAAGWEPLEVYPHATLRLLGLPTAGKRTREGRRRIHDALGPLVPGLDEYPDASEHQLDAAACALTAHLWRVGRARCVGAADEGTMVIPVVAVVPPRLPREPRPPRRPSPPALPSPPPPPPVAHRRNLNAGLVVPLPDGWCDAPPHGTWRRTGGSTDGDDLRGTARPARGGIVREATGTGGHHRRSGVERGCPRRHDRLRG